MVSGSKTGVHREKREGKMQSVIKWAVEFVVSEPSWQAASDEKAEVNRSHLKQQVLR